MNEVQKIAFSGVAGVGKDFLVSHLVNEYGFLRLSFSDQLKKMCHDMFPWLKEDYSPEEKETKIKFDTGYGIVEKTPREIWLEVGALCRLDQGIFIRRLEETYNRISGMNIVISDIRTQSELDWCKKNGFKTVYISGDAVHPLNEFDKQQTSFKDQFDFQFENDFNGIDKFKKFYEENLIKL